MLELNCVVFRAFSLSFNELVSKNGNTFYKVEMSCKPLGVLSLLAEKEVKEKFIEGEYQDYVLKFSKDRFNGLSCKICNIKENITND